MVVWLVVILAISAVSLIFNVGYIVHELGWFPHTRDRSSPSEVAFPFQSRYERDVQSTHDFQVAVPLTNILRKYGHPDVYNFEDPYRALENVIRRYEERPTQSTRDDLIHLSNYICNHVRCDEKINSLIGQIHRMIDNTPAKGA